MSPKIHLTQQYIKERKYSHSFLRYQVLHTKKTQMNSIVFILKAYSLVGDWAYQALLFCVISLSKSRGNYTDPWGMGQAGSRECVTPKYFGKEELNGAEQCFHHEQLANLDKTERSCPRYQRSTETRIIRDGNIPERKDLLKTELSQKCFPWGGLLIGWKC